MSCVSLVGTLMFCLAQPSQSQSIPIALTNIDATASPAGGATNFAAVDVAGFYGSPGANIYLGPAQLSLWTNSGDHAANIGVLNPTAGTFALNWTCQALFGVFDASGSQIGTGTLFVDSPETGTYNTNTGIVLSETTSPSSAQMVLKRSGSSNSTTNNSTIVNINFFLLAAMAPGEYQGTFQPPPPDPLTITLPSALGGGVLNADLSGTIVLAEGTAIPTLSEWGLIIMGMLLLVAGAWFLLRHRRGEMPAVGGE